MDGPEERNAGLSLGPTAPDYITAAIRGVLGAVPYAGSLLAEILGAIIPNQRMDRLARFAEQLDVRLREIEHTVVREQLGNENFTELVDEGARQAVRAVSDERLAYIANLITHGISSEHIKYVESKHLLRMLGELNDLEIVWLRSYLSSRGDDEEFYEAHRGVLDPISPAFGDPESDVDKAAIEDSYSEHLANLDLLEREYEIETSHRTTRLKVRSYRLTTLGRLMLRAIGLASEEDF